MSEQPAFYPPTPPQTDEVEPVPQSPDLIDAVPAYTMPVILSPQVEPRHVIDAVPSQEELEQGSEYTGEAGEYTDAARLLGALEQFDPHHKLQDETVRAKAIAYMGVGTFKQVLVKVNETLYPENSGDSLADQEVTLGFGSDDERQVGFIGADPRDVDELLEGVLAGVKQFAAEGDLHKAGVFLANSLVPLQIMKDGNKRMARALYELVAFGYDASHYDQSAIRKRLAYTQEARSSMNYTVARGFIEQFAVEDMSPDERTMFRRMNLGMSDMTKRAELRTELESVTDSALRERVINALQQPGFGAKYVYDSLSPARLQSLTESTASFDRDAIKTGVKGAISDLCKSLDNQKAQELVEKDRQTRKEYLLRVMDSTTGKRPLAASYNPMTQEPTGQIVSIVE